LAAVISRAGHISRIVGHEEEANYFVNCIFMPPLQGLFLLVTFTRGFARFARSTPGFIIAAFQACETDAFRFWHIVDLIWFWPIFWVW
jgi:hypothetical protein